MVAQASVLTLFLRYSIYVQYVVRVTSVVFSPVLCNRSVPFVLSLISSAREEAQTPAIHLQMVVMVTVAT